jgi:hypothetical protein
MARPSADAPPGDTTQRDRNGTTGVLKRNATARKPKRFSKRDVATEKKEFRPMPKSLFVLLSLLPLAGCIDVYEQPKPAPTTIITPPSQGGTGYTPPPSQGGTVYVPPGGTVVTRP